MDTFNGFSRKLKDFIFRFWGAYNHLSSEAYIDELQSRGCKVGEGTKFYGEKNVDLGYASLITIGRNCVITDKARILAHARDDLVLSRTFDKSPMDRKRGPVKIGDNVFIGERTIVLPGVEIGDDVIIGAGSVVASNIPSETVAAGVPCEVKSSLEEYRDHRVATEESDIEKAVEQYHERDVRPPRNLVEYLNKNR